MTVGNKIYPVIFAVVFVLILIIGVFSKVSFIASINRAVLAAVFFTALCWIAGKTVFKYAVSGLSDVKSQKYSEKQQESNFSVTVGNPASSSPEDYSRTSLGQTVSSLDKAERNNSSQEFVPLSARQIDPDASKVIGSNPERMAENVRKMG